MLEILRRSIALPSVLVMLGACCPKTDLNSRQTAQRRVARERQSADLRYEINLREADLTEMEAEMNEALKRPGVVGVSPQWVQRRDALKDKITDLRVRQHTIDSELEDLPK